MSAPDRPTREQVDAALAATNGLTRWSVLPDRAVLAAEVRALRAELDRVHSALRHESDAHIAERDRLRAALAARTPQPAEHEIADSNERAWIADAMRVGAGHLTKLGNKTSTSADRYKDERAEPLNRVARHYYRAAEAIRDAAAAFVGAPLPAVPDGEDATAICPLCHRRAALVLDAHGHFGPDIEAEDEIMCDVSHWRLSWAAEKAAGGRPDTRSSLPIPGGEDVPARLDAAADALEAISPGWGTAADYFRMAAEELRDGPWAEEACAAVAAALARSTEREQ